MLSSSDFAVVDALELIARLSVPSGFLVPTETGLSKSIMDAHRSFRSFLREEGVHDFSTQRQGQDSKIQIPILVHVGTDIHKRLLSLYRPSTKKGDPRVWVSGLSSLVSAGNLLAIVKDGSGELHLLNMSDEKVRMTLQDSGSLLRRSFATANQFDEAEAELLDLLHEIHLQGYLPTLRDGPTGVGFTLETALGIAANSSRNPDFKGIEIKSGRTTRQGRHGSRTSLFSQVPDWGVSACKSGIEILDRIGYVDPESGRRQLYCTNSSTPNSLGLYLRIEEGESGNLLESERLQNSNAPEPIATWPMWNLVTALKEKHAKTVWVGARVRLGNSDREEFHYHEAQITNSPMVGNLETLIEEGIITMDYTLSMKANGKSRDHGYLFKIHADDSHLLFPEVRQVPL